ncbi:MAG: hypothetical protein Rhims3KO_22890 [Hyphomicrobiales bacterium]
MAAIITLSARAASARTKPNPTPTSVPCACGTNALRNPARHGVTPMAPQDFPLCAAFQEE